MVPKRPGQPPKSAELPPAKCSREPFHTAFCCLRTRIAPDAVIPRKGGKARVWHRPFEELSSTHREGTATGPRGPGSARVPAGVCRLLGLLLSSVQGRTRARGPLGYWSSSCCDDSFKDGTLPGRAPVSRPGGQFPGKSFTAHWVAFHAPLPPSLDLTVHWLLFSLHLLNLYSGVLSSLSCPMCSSALPLLPPMRAAACPTPRCPIARCPIARCPAGAIRSLPEHLGTCPDPLPDSGVHCLSKAKKVFSL